MLRHLRAEFEDALAEALVHEGFSSDDLGIEEPPDGFDAVVASSVAFRLASEAGQPPPAVASRLHDAIDIAQSRYIDAVELTGPYLNVHPGGAYYIDTIDAARASDFCRLPPVGESVVVEHTSANPTGPVHIGRARNPIIGDALARLLDAAGYDVETHYYVNDAGRQMALFTWAYETFDEDDLPPPARDRIEYDLVRYYRHGNAYLEQADDAERERIEADIEALMRGIERGDADALERVSEVVDQVLAGMRECLERLPAAFDEFVKETSFILDGSTSDVVERLQSAKEADKVDGAWQLDLSTYGIDKEFIFVRSDGTTLYTTRDVAHHEWKFEHFDRAITVLGEAQELHARQLRTALDILGNDVDRLEEVFYGWVNLPGGEGMSTRKGTGIQLDDLLDEAIERARDEVERRLDDRTRGGDLTDDDIASIAEDIGIGAVRYDIVSTQAVKPITFEWDRALDFESQSAPYVQYVHARCCGILERADRDRLVEVASAPTHPSARGLTEEIARLPFVVVEAADARSPHRVASYLLDLADAFNGFYRDCPVLEAEGETRAVRLALVDASRQTVASGLDLLGVAAPESM